MQRKWKCSILLRELRSSISLAAKLLSQASANDSLCRCPVLVKQDSLKAQIVEGDPKMHNEHQTEQEPKLKLFPRLSQFLYCNKYA